MARLGPLALLLLLAKCSGGASAPVTPTVKLVPLPTRPAVRVVLQPGEHRTFQPGALRAGDIVSCNGVRVRIPRRFGGGWAIGKGVASPGGPTRTVKITSRSGGSATASCSG